MKITYDPTTDTITIVFKDARVVESDESRPGIILDLDERGDVVAIEVLDASQRMTDPRVFEVRAAG